MFISPQSAAKLPSAYSIWYCNWFFFNIFDFYFYIEFKAAPYAESISFDKSQRSESTSWAGFREKARLCNPFLGVLSKNQTQQEKKRIGNRYCPMQIMKTSLASEVDRFTNALENVCKSVKKVHRWELLVQHYETKCPRYRWSLFIKTPATADNS